MAWDSSRPVPYRRLIKEWVVYAAIMTAIFLLFLRDDSSDISLLFGLLASLPLYIGFSYVLAKLGYQRKTLAELRTPRATSSSTSASGSAAPGPPSTAVTRDRPAPTRRTSAGRNRPTQKPAARRRR